MGRSATDAQFATLVANRQLAWYALSRRILRDPRAAEDALQEALLLAWQNRHQLRDAEALDAWIRRIVTRVSLRRRESPPSPLAAEMPGPGVVESQVLDRWAARQAIAVIEALPPRQRAAVFSRLLEDRPYPSIAERLGCTEATARSLVRWGLQRVRQATAPGTA